MDWSNGGTTDEDTSTNTGSNAWPWYSLRNSTNTVVIEKGVTNVGASAFDKCTNITDVVKCSGLR